VRKQGRLGWLLVTVLSVLQADAHAMPPGTIEVSIRDGALVPLQPEKVHGLKARPLAKLKQRLDQRFGPDFLTLLRLPVEDGTELVGRCAVTTAPIRLTVYEISRKKHDHDRTLRVAATAFYPRPGATAEFRTKVQGHQEELFLITAERVDSADELNSHLAYMRRQDNSITVKGFSTNWNLSVLKVHLSGRGKAHQQVSFTKDAEWLVDHLIRPVWVASIRFDQN